MAWADGNDRSLGAAASEILSPVEFLQLGVADQLEVLDQLARAGGDNDGGAYLLGLRGLAVIAHGSS